MLIFLTLLQLLEVAHADRAPLGKAWSCHKFFNLPNGVIVQFDNQGSPEFPTVISMEYSRHTEPFDGSWYAESDRLQRITKTSPSEKDGWYVYSAERAEMEKWKKGEKVSVEKTDFLIRIEINGKEEAARQRTVHRAEIEYRAPGTKEKRLEKGECVVQSWGGSPGGKGGASKPSPDFVPEVSKLK